MSLSLEKIFIEYSDPKYSKCDDALVIARMAEKLIIQEKQKKDTTWIKLLGKDILVKSRNEAKKEYDDFKEGIICGLEMGDPKTKTIA